MQRHLFAMNKDYIDLSTPKQAGWHWWKSSAEADPIDINVSDSDIKNNKFKNFGGEWHHFPTFNEVMEYRQAYYDLYQRAKANETNLRNAENALIAYHNLLLKVSEKTFVPKAEIKELLSKVSGTSTPVPQGR